MERDLGQIRVDSAPFLQLNQFFPGGGGKQVFANWRDLSAEESAYSSGQAGTNWARHAPSSNGGRELQRDEWNSSSWRFDGASLRAERNSAASEANSSRNRSGGAIRRRGSGTDLGLHLEPGSVGDGREVEHEVIEIEDDEAEMPSRTFLGRHTPSPPSNEPNPYSRGDESPEDDGTLSLKLGGGSYAYSEDNRAGKRARSSSPQAQVSTCQVDGCTADLSRAKDYHRRHKVCEAHSKATKALVSRVMQRFCQQCSRFHPLEQFDEGKRSCRRRLAGHNKRRRKTQPEAAGGRVEEPAGAKNADLVTLLGVLTQLKGPLERASAAASEQDLLLQCLRQVGNLPGGAVEGLGRSAPSWGQVTRGPEVGPGGIDPQLLASQLSGRVPVQPQDAIAMLLQNNLKQAAMLAQESMYHRAGVNGSMNGAPMSYPPSQADASGRHAVPQSSAAGMSMAGGSRMGGGIDPGQLLASVALSMQQSIAGSTAGQGRNAAANGLGSAQASGRRGVPDQPAADTRNFLGRRSDGHQEGDGRGPARAGGQRQASQSQQRPLLGSRQGRASSQRPSIDLQQAPSEQYSDASETGSGSGSGLGSGSGSGSGSGHHSPGTPPAHRENSRISFKLFDKHPEQFPDGLRSQIDEWLSHRPSNMEGFIRPGCVILSLFVCMPSSAWSELTRDLAGSAKRLLSMGCEEFWCTGRILMHAGQRSVSIVDGEITECRTCDPLGSPYLLSVRPLAVVAGEENRLVVSGLNLGRRLLCAFRGEYHSEEAYEQEQAEDESVAAARDTDGPDEVEDTADSRAEDGVAGESGEEDSGIRAVGEASSAWERRDSERRSSVGAVSEAAEGGEGSVCGASSWEDDDSAGGRDDAVSVGRHGDGDVSRSIGSGGAAFDLRRSTFSCTVRGGGFGRCFVEMDHGTLEGNWKPVIVADGAVAAEIRSLEGEIERAASTAGRVAEGHGLEETVVLYCKEVARLAEEEDVTRFLHELGWFFQRSHFRCLSSAQASPVACTRLKQLLVYSVERNWCAVVQRVLDMAFEGEEWGEIFSALSDMSEEGASLLHRAVRNKSRAMVEALLGYAPSFLGGPDDGDAEGLKRRLEFRVEWGAMFKPDMRGAGGLSPLHVAASLQDGEEMVDALTSGPCQMGLHAWLHKQDDFGETPLSLALAGGHRKSVQVVRGKLARLENPGSTVIEIAAGWERQWKGDAAAAQVELPAWRSSSGARASASASAEGEGAGAGAGAGASEPRRECREQDFARLPRDVCGMKGAIYRPFLVSIMGIACICVCVCLLLRGPQNVLQGFTWSGLKQGPK